jgi:tetratricopeptide (TPR) repeat protein/predicted Ser/Thr protein kinase
VQYNCSLRTVSETIDDELNAAVRSAADLDDPEAEWTRAEVARRLLARTSAPSKIGRFTVVRFVGAGAMGRVFLAYDEVLDRPVAIKLLARHTEDHARQRLIREAQALAKLSHPNVVQVYEVGTHQDTPFIAMEFLRGATFRAWQDERPEMSAVLSAYALAGQGLAAAHEEGLVHRDFKPDNVFVEQDDDVLRVRVIDFGLALVGESSDTETTGVDDLRLTRSATLLGTPLYMAPEQLRGGPATAASDQFSFCVSLAEALSGAHPYDADTIEALRSAHDKPPRLPKEVRAPAHVRSALLRGMSADPSKRFPSMGALLQQLGHDPAAGRRRWFAATGLTAIVGALVLAAGNAEAPAPCAGAKEAFSGVWTDARRQALATSFGALESPHAGDALQRAQTRLDAFETRWVEQHEDACLDTNVRHEQSEALMDRRMLCLDHAKRSFDVVARVLETQADAVFDRVDRVIDTLPHPDRCADVSTLGGAALPPSAERRAGVEQAQALATEAEALRVAGSPHASDRARKAVERADEVAYPLEQAHARLVLGQALDDEGDTSAALNALSEALEFVARTETSPLLREIVAARFSIELGRGELEAAATLEPLLTGISSSPADLADLAIRRGTRAMAQGNEATAAEHFREAVRLYAPLQDPLQLAAAHRALGVALVRQGRFDDATHQATRAVNLLEQAFGRGHRATANERAYLADILRMAGDFEQAEQQARQAVAIMEAIRGPRHRETAEARRTLGGVLLQAGRYEEALDELQTAVQVLDATAGDELEAANAHGDLGAALDFFGRPEEAVEEFRRALSVTEARRGPHHPDTARQRDNLGAMLAGVGDFQGSLREIRAALRVRIDNYGELHPEVAASYANLGATFETSGDFAAAEPEYAKAVRIAGATEGPDHPNTVYFEANRGHALTKLGRAEEAVPLLEHALKIRRTLYPEGDPYTLDSQVNLGHALCLTGDRTRGLALLRAAVELGAQHDAQPPETFKANLALAECSKDAPTVQAALERAREAAHDHPELLATLEASAAAR